MDFDWALKMAERGDLVLTSNSGVSTSGCGCCADDFQCSKEQRKVIAEAIKAKWDKWVETGKR